MTIAIETRTVREATAVFHQSTHPQADAWLSSGFHRAEISLLASEQTMREKPGRIDTTLAGGGGALIGAAMAKFIGDHHAAHLQKQLDRGGLLLWVRAWNEADERTASAILRKHAGSDVHIHDFPVPTP